MQTIRVYRVSGGLYATYSGIYAETEMMAAFGGNVPDSRFIVLR